MKIPVFLARDREFVLSAAENLEAYLLSSELYGPSVYRGGLDLSSRLTPGALLLAVKRLEGYQDPEDLPFHTALESVVQIQSRWRAHWQKKCLREFSSRMASWKDFLDGWLENSHPGNEMYAVGVRQRAMIHLLEKNAGTIDDNLVNSLSDCDQRLKAATEAGCFLWESELEFLFPQPEWWFLYRCRTR